MLSKENIKWSWRILRANSYVAADEKTAICSINLRDPSTFDNILMISAQYTSLVDFRDRLSEVIKEHEVASEQLFGKSIKKRG